MTFLSYTDWSNFSVASIDTEKTFIGLGPGEAILQVEITTMGDLSKFKWHNEILVAEIMHNFIDAA